MWEREALKGRDKINLELSAALPSNHHKFHTHSTPFQEVYQQYAEWEKGDEQAW